VDLASQIAEKAASLFDVTGFTRLADGSNLLVLALESTQEQDLDEFGTPDGGFNGIGFKKHILPRLEPLLSFIRNQGFSADLTGRFGYPQNGVLNIKEEAIRAGLGKRGKSTVVLHPEYGTRLRFAAIKTDAPVDTLIAPPPLEEKSPICSDCSICIDACPVNALEPYQMPDTSLCLSNLNIMKEERDRLVLCDICLHQCSVNPQ